MSTSAHSSASRPSTSDMSERLTRSIDDLERQVRDLRAQLIKERETRRNASERSRQKRRAATGSRDELVATWTGDAARDEQEVKQLLETRLSKLDDEALTALLTLSTSSLVKLVAGGGVETTSSVLAIPTLLVPTKSVGIEGLGSGGEIDRRLAKADVGILGKRQRALGIEASVERKKDQDTPGSDPVEDARDKARQATWMKEWLEGRKERNERLLTHLSRFTHLHIISLTQRITPSSLAKSDNTTIRSVHLTGSLSDLCPLTLRYEIHDTTTTSSSSRSSFSSSPQLQNLHLNVPDPLRSALSPANHLTRTLRHANLPALMLSLRTLLPLTRLRQGLFRTLEKRYADLVPAPSKGDSWTPPPASSDARVKMKMQDVDVLARLVEPKRAEKLIFVNARKATLTLSFLISFTRYGHAYPTIHLTPTLPSSMLSSHRQLVETFQDRFQHLLAYLTSPQRRQNVVDDDEAGGERLVGVQAAIVAVVDAFFAVP